MHWPRRTWPEARLQRKQHDSPKKTRAAWRDKLPKTPLWQTTQELKPKQHKNRLTMRLRLRHWRITESTVSMITTPSKQSLCSSQLIAQSLTKRDVKQSTKLQPGPRKKRPRATQMDGSLK